MVKPPELLAGFLTIRPTDPYVHIVDTVVHIVNARETTP